MKVRISFSKGFLPLLFSSLLMVLCLAGCAENSSILDNGGNLQLGFSVSTYGWSNSSDQNIPSRAAPISGTTFDISKSFNVIADVNKGGNWSTEINNETASYSRTNNIWQTSATHYWPGSGSTVNFYAYYPTSILNNITHTAGSAPVLSYTVPDNATDQIDILASSKTGVAGDSYNQTPVDFKHIFAAIQFSVGSNGMPSGTITGVALNNIQYKGTYSLDGTWIPNTTDKKSFSQTVSIPTNAGTVITSGTTTFMMMPQTLSNASITVTYSNKGTLTKTISGTWEAGKTYTYNLSYLPRTFGYTGTVQTYTVPVTGTYKLEVWGAEGNIKGGYSSGIKSLSAGTTVYIYVGGKNSDGSFLNGNGSTDIRLNGLIYTPFENTNIAIMNGCNSCYYGPYWHNSTGTYQVDATGSGFDNCSFEAYNNDPWHPYTVTNMIKTSYHFTAYINVDLDVSSTVYTGIEFITAWDNTKYTVTISNEAISKLSDRIIVGAGDNSSNSTSGVANGFSQDQVWSGNGMARITLLSIP